MPSGAGQGRGVKRTKAGTIVVAIAIGVFLGFAVDQVLTATGRPTFTPSFLLPILLVLLGIALVLFALPIRRATAGRRPRRSIPSGRPHRDAGQGVDPRRRRCRRCRGGTSGLPDHATRRALVRLDRTGDRAIVGGLVLVAAGLVAEHLCTIRKDDDDEHPGPPEPGLGLSHHD
jgi:hypothetical protein